MLWLLIRIASKWFWCEITTYSFMDKYRKISLNYYQIPTLSFLLLQTLYQVCCTCKGCDVSLDTLDTDDDGESLCFRAESGTIRAVTSPSLLVHTASPHTLIKHWHWKQKPAPIVNNFTHKWTSSCEKGTCHICKQWGSNLSSLARVFAVPSHNIGKSHIYDPFG